MAPQLSFCDRSRRYRLLRYCPHEPELAGAAQAAQSEVHNHRFCFGGDEVEHNLRQGNFQLRCPDGGLQRVGGQVRKWPGSHVSDGMRGRYTEREFLRRVFPLSGQKAGRATLGLNYRQALAASAHSKPGRSSRVCRCSRNGHGRERASVGFPTRNSTGAHRACGHRPSRIWPLLPGLYCSLALLLLLQQKRAVP